MNCRKWRSFGYFSDWSAISSWNKSLEHLIQESVCDHGRSNQRVEAFDFILFFIWDQNSSQNLHSQLLAVDPEKELELVRVLPLGTQRGDQWSPDLECGPREPCHYWWNHYSGSLRGSWSALRRQGLSLFTKILFEPIHVLPSIAASQVILNHHKF